MLQSRRRSGTLARCSVWAQHSGEPMAGTAPATERLLLVEQPGPWGPLGLLDSRCDPEVAARVDQAANAAGLRVQLIRRPGRREPSVTPRKQLVGVADTRPGVESVRWWQLRTMADLPDQLRALADLPDQLRALADLSDQRRALADLPDQRRALADLPDAAAPADRTPTYLVCTHAKRDTCCALQGRPVVAALDQIRPGRVWETTHLGGHRFAANLLVLPTGELYGRVSPALLPEIVDRVDAGELVPGLLRGRVGLPPSAQAALIFAHQRLGVDRRADLQVTSVDGPAGSPVAGTVVRVGLSGPAGELTVTVEVGTSPPIMLSCGGPSDVKVPTYRAIAIELAGQRDASPERT